MTIDPDADRPIYRQLADVIRAAIAAGEEVQLTESALAQQHGVSRDSVRKAVALLRSEGLIVTDRAGSRVREPQALQTLPVPAGASVSARMPTDPERRALSVGEGVPVLVVTLDGEEKLYPADRYQLVG